MIWTREKEDALISMNRDGATPSSLAAVFETSVDAIYAKLRRLGETPNRMTRPDGSVETRGGGLKVAKLPVEIDDTDNPNFLYKSPGYYVDRTGERWLVGEDADGDLVGINVLHADPQVQYWSPNGLVPGAKGHARDLVGPYIARYSPRERGIDLAADFHRSV